MLDFVSSSVVDVSGFELLSPTVADGFLLGLYKVWLSRMVLSGSSTYWWTGGFEVRGSDGVIILVVFYVERGYVLSLNIMNGVDMGGCLISTHMVTSLSYSVAWYE